MAEFLAGGASVASTLAPPHFNQLIATSGALWMTGAVGTAVANTEHSKVSYGAAFVNLVAGATELTTGSVSGSKQAIVAGVSAAAWGANAMTTVVMAASDTKRTTPARLTQGLGGALNLGAAAAAGAGTLLASAGKPGVVAVGVASGVLWAGGAVLQGASSWMEQRYSVPNRPGDPEANTSVTPVNRSGTAE
jgi:hypothetical protein